MPEFFLQFQSVDIRETQLRGSASRLPLEQRLEGGVDGRHLGAAVAQRQSAGIPVAVERSTVKRIRRSPLTPVAENQT